MCVLLCHIGLMMCSIIGRLILTGLQICEAHFPPKNQQQPQRQYSNASDPILTPYYIQLQGNQYSLQFADEISHFPAK